MKYLLLFSLLLLLVFPLKSQESKFQIGITGSADVAYRTLFKIDDEPYLEAIINSRNSREIPKLGCSGGVSLSYLLNDHFTLFGGLQYSNMGYKTKPLLLSFGDVDPRRGFIYSGEEAYNLRYVYSYHYIEIPISIQYQLGKKKWKPILSLGIIPGYLAGGISTVVRDYESGDVDRSRSQLDLSFANRFSLTPFANLGVNYQMNETWSIQASAHFRYNVFFVYDTPITMTIWNGGLQVGCFYRL